MDSSDRDWSRLHLARKELRTQLGPLKKENGRLKTAVAGLRKEINDLRRKNALLARQTKPVLKTVIEGAAAEDASPLQPTARAVRALRKQLEQAEAEPGFQLPHMAAHCRMGDLQLPRRRADTAGLIHRRKGPQRIQG